MENEGDLDNVDNKISGYTIDLNLPWIHKQYFMRNKNVIIEFGLRLFENLAWTIYAPFMAIKDIIFAFWYLITKQWDKLSLIAFILDICILAVCVFGILFFVPGLPVIVHLLGLLFLLLPGYNSLSLAVFGTLEFMSSSEEKSFYAYEVYDQNGNKKKVFLSSKADDSQNLNPIDRFKMGHKMLYFYRDDCEIAYQHQVSDIGIKFFTKSPSSGIGTGISGLCSLLFPVAVPVLSFVTLFLIFKYSRDGNQKNKKAMIKWFIAFLFLDLLLVFDVLLFISGMPVAIYWIGYISSMLTCAASFCILSRYVCDHLDVEKIHIYPRKQGDKKYFKLKKDLSVGETRINAQEIKPSMGVFLPVKDET